MEGKQLSVRVHMIVLPSLKYSRITDAKQIDSRIAIQEATDHHFFAVARAMRSPCGCDNSASAA
jgi:hypothetical protein